jgi:hypothetical protein
MKQQTTTLLVLLVTLTGCAIDPFDEEQPPLTASNVLNAIPEPAEQPAEAEANPNASRLWFHVRNEQQQQLVESLKDSLKLDETVVIEPVQLVEAGPRKTQLRFFSPQDKEKAKTLLKKLHKVFPKLGILDLSAEYGASIVPGHFELWLAPDLTKITLP